jgi:hypothetical protein
VACCVCVEPGALATSVNAALACPRHTPNNEQALASNGRFGRGLAPEQQTFLVLADTVLKQLDALKSTEPSVSGPVRRCGGGGVSCACMASASWPCGAGTRCDLSPPQSNPCTPNPDKR